MYIDHIYIYIIYVYITKSWSLSISLLKFHGVKAPGTHMEHLVFQILAMRFLERCRRGLSPDGRLDLGAHRKVILDMEGKSYTILSIQAIQ